MYLPYETLYQQGVSRRSEGKSMSVVLLESSTPNSWKRPLLPIIAGEQREGLNPRMAVFGVQIAYCAAMFEIHVSRSVQFHVGVMCANPFCNTSFCFVFKDSPRAEIPYWIYKQSRERDKSEHRTYS